jgi:hypothetical protein
MRRTRSVNGVPTPADLPNAVWINPPAKKKAAQDASDTTIVTPIDLQHPPISGSDDRSAATTINLGTSLISSFLVSQCH